MTEDEVLFSDTELKESFGDYLRRHREASGKTLEGIARTTRISKRFLLALEESDTKTLPEVVFARGFLKAYAKEVGLDVEDCVLRYDRFCKSLMPTQIKEVRKPPKMGTLGGEGFEPLSNQKWLIWGLAAGVVVAGLVAAILFLIQALPKEKATAQAPKLETLSPDENVIEAPPADLPLGPALVKSETVKTPEVMVTPVKPSVLTIKALKDAKLSVRVDESPIQEVELKAGESRDISVFKGIEIRNSERGSFAFLYNGKPLDISGPVIKLFNRNLYSKKP